MSESEILQWFKEHDVYLTVGGGKSSKLVEFVSVLKFAKYFNFHMPNDQKVVLADQFLMIAPPVDHLCTIEQLLSLIQQSTTCPAPFQQFSPNNETNLY
jgi:hypothetical protein